MTSRMDAELVELDGYGQRVRTFHADREENMENETNRDDAGSLEAIIARRAAANKDAWKKGRKWDEYRRRHDTGVYKPDPAAEKTLAFAREANRQTDELATSLGLSVPERFEPDPGGPQRNSESPRLAPMPSQVDEDTVGDNDSVRAARDAMAARNANRWQDSRLLRQARKSAARALR